MVDWHHLKLVKCTASETHQRVKLDAVPCQRWGRSGAVDYNLLPFPGEPYRPRLRVRGPAPLVRWFQWKLKGATEQKHNLPKLHSCDAVSEMPSPICNAFPSRCNKVQFNPNTNSHITYFNPASVTDFRLLVLQLVGLRWLARRRL